jgi:hypothetical protein
MKNQVIPVAGKETLCFMTKITTSHPTAGLGAMFFSLARFKENPKSLRQTG